MSHCTPGSEYRVRLNQVTEHSQLTFDSTFSDHVRIKVSNSSCITAASNGTVYIDRCEGLPSIWEQYELNSNEASFVSGYASWLSLKQSGEALSQLSQSSDVIWTLEKMGVIRGKRSDGVDMIQTIVCNWSKNRPGELSVPRTTSYSGSKMVRQPLRSPYRNWASERRSLFKSETS